MRIPTLYQFQREATLIAKQFNELRQLQAQVSSGKKIINSSDDPVLASQIKSTEDFLTVLGTYDKNGVLAAGRAKYFDTSIQSANNLMNRVRELIQTAQDDSKTDPNAKAGIIRELQGNLASLLNIANAKDANGSYIFGGTNANATAFVGSNGIYQYQGGMDAMMIDIGQNVRSVYNECGYNVFGDIYSGNGSFTISSGVSNTGTAYTTAGSVVNRASYVADTYTLTFVTNSSGKLAYQVIGATSGQVIPQPPATTPASAPDFVNDSDITFNGISFHVKGQPKVGDTFQVAPSSKQNVFNSLQSTIDALSKPINNEVDLANFHHALNQCSAAMSQVSSHFQNYISEVGSREKAIDNQIESNNKMMTNQNTMLLNLSNANLAEVFSALMQQTLALQATQEGYMKMQEVMSKLLQL